MPVFLFRAIFGGIFIVVGALPLLLLPKATLECQRLEPTYGTCELKRQSVLGGPVETFRLGELLKADVKSRQDSDGGTTYRVELELAEDKTLPLTGYWSSGRQPKRDIANAIEAFLSDQTQTQLQVRQDDRWFGYLFGGIFGITGLIVFLIPFPIKS